VCFEERRTEKKGLKGLIKLNEEKGEKGEKKFIIKMLR